MRLLGISFALLLLAAANAQADVFVPDDPPPSEAGCVAVAGDVVVTARGEEGGIEVSTAGGPYLELPTGTLDQCPAAAAAADGTAAIAAGGELYVRRGGSLAAPVKLTYDLADLAVAPGGWVVAAGRRMTFRRHVPRVELLATTVAPDGSARTAVLARGEAAGPPRAGIDAQGRAAVAWPTRKKGYRYDIRVGSPGGPTRVAARDIEDPFAGASQIDVAVTPAGHTLLAWTDAHGIAASFDGGPAQRAGSDAGALHAELGEDGSALIASASGGGVLVTDRAGTGPWVTHTLAHFPASDYEFDAPPTPDLRTALAPDGRAAVAWGEGDVLAANGRVGVAWTPGVRQSAVTREADSPSLTLAADGAPRLVWVESADDASRLRGARLSPAGVADTTPPVLTTSLPSRTPRTRTGNVTLRVPVTCSEACDARVQLVHGSRVYGSVVSELAAGRRQTFVLRPDTFAGLMMAGDPSLRHPRLEVVVTDRAGNVARRSGTVAFRIVDRPLLDYRVAPGHDFAMFTKAGNRAVARLVNGLVTGLARGTITSRRDLRRRFVRGRAAIRRTHDEIDDTEVGDAIFEALYVPCKRRGIDPEYVVSG